MTLPQDPLTPFGEVRAIGVHILTIGKKSFAIICYWGFCIKFAENDHCVGGGCVKKCPKLRDVIYGRPLN